jgi:hypothetical protein
MQSGGKGSQEDFLNAIRNETAPFGCVQDLQNLPANLRNEIQATLEEKFYETLPSKKI